MKYGVRILKGDPSKTTWLEDSKLPVNALNAIPRGIQTIFSGKIVKNDNGRQDLEWGRYVSIILSLFLGWYIFLWSYRIFGINGGLLSLVCWSICPNIIAHARLVGTDMYQVLTALATCYHFSRFLLARKNFHYWWSVCWLAAALISKQSNILLPFFILITTLIILMIQGRLKRIFTKNTFVKALGAIAIILFSINASHAFKDSCVKFRDQHFVSVKYKSIAAQLDPYIGNLPVPLPVAYITGFDWVQYAKECADGHCGLDFYCSNYLNGVYSPRAFGNYYLLTLWYKTPFIFFIALLAVITSLLLNRKKITYWKDISIISALAIMFLAYFSFFSGLQHGVRHILVVYACLYILCGAITYLFRQRITSYVIALLFMFHLYTLANYIHSPIAYTNGFLADKKMVYKIFYNSNIDFGQTADDAFAFMRQHPGYHFPTAVPAPGKYIISLNNLVGGCNTDRERSAWLRNNFEPVDHLYYSYFLFDITEKEFRQKIK